MSLFSVVQQHGRCDETFRDESTGLEYMSWDVLKSVKPFNQPIVYIIGRRITGKSNLNLAIVNALIPMMRTLWIIDETAGFTRSYLHDPFVRHSLEVTQGIRYVVNPPPPVHQSATDAVLAYQEAVLLEHDEKSLMVCIITRTPEVNLHGAAFMAFLERACLLNIYVIIECENYRQLYPKLRKINNSIVLRAYQNDKKETKCFIKERMSVHMTRWSAALCRRACDILPRRYRFLVAVEGEVLWFRAHADESRRTQYAQLKTQQMQSFSARHFEPRYLQALNPYFIPELAQIVCGYLNIQELVEAAIDVVRNAEADPTRLAMSQEAHLLSGHDPEWKELVPVKHVTVL
jgi:hypothetical protein